MTEDRISVHMKDIMGFLCRIAAANAYRFMRRNLLSGNIVTYLDGIAATILIWELLQGVFPVLTQIGTLM
jgi:hypothetical protein